MLTILKTSKFHLNNAFYLASRPSNNHLTKYTVDSILNTFFVF